MLFAGKLFPKGVALIVRKNILLPRIFFLSVIMFFFCAGCRDASDEKDTKPAGRWHTLMQAEGNGDQDDERYEKLIGLGYLQGHDKTSESWGVIFHAEKFADNNLNFCVSGHAPSAYIINMNGDILHRWAYKKATEIWPDLSEKNNNISYWRRAHLFPNGDLLAIYEGIGMIKIDKDSNLLWASSGKKKAHHDLEVSANGTIYVLTREGKQLPEISQKMVLDEYISLVASDGTDVKHFSMIDMIAMSEYRSLLERKIVRKGGFFGHILHANTIELLEGVEGAGSDLFRRGNVLVSILMLDLVCVFDLDKQVMVWAMGGGMWAKQHQPTLLPSGRMLLFDNKYVLGKKSRVIEFDPFTQEILWQYGNKPEEQFYSETCGSCQRLPNGNTLITITDSGEAKEVTDNGKIVWHYINPHRAGAEQELIASLFEVVRINQQDYPFLQTP